MKPALAQVSTLAAPFEKDLADYAAARCEHVELWLGKLETYLQSRDAAAAQAILAEHHISAPVASYQGGLFAPPGASRDEHWALFLRRAAVLSAIGVETLVVAADFAGPLAHDDIDRVKSTLGQAADIAQQHNLRLALEFQARSTFCNNLQTAAALVHEVGHPHLGLCLDLFHFQVGPSKLSDLAETPPELLFHVQLSDLAGVPREMAADADRILPGDGDFPTAAVIDHLRAIDYRHYVSIELLNPRLWSAAPLSFAEIAMTSLRKALGLAAMG
jgi:4-hydroxyphenylpyruvate dioxygenase